MKHILLATDGSGGADRAADIAGELATATGAKLSIVTVGNILVGQELKQLARAEGNVPDAIDTVCNATLQQARERLQKAGLSNVLTQTAWGDPAEVLIDMARRIQVDAIVLGRRGRGRLAGLLLGSVSQKVASLAPCVVIVVP